MSIEDSEHLVDPLDIASRSAHTLNESAIAEAQRRLVRKRNPVKPKNKNGTWPKGAWEETDCVECGEEIPVERLEATGSDLCVHCATVKERARGQLVRRNP